LAPRSIFKRTHQQGQHRGPGAKSAICDWLVCRVVSHDKMTECTTTHTLGVLIHGDYINFGWLGSRVVSVLDSGAEGPGFKSQSRRCRVTVLGKLFTPIVPCASVYQAAKLVADLLRLARVTAGLAEGNGSLPPGL